jgi:hypothetical protein
LSLLLLAAFCLLVVRASSEVTEEEDEGIVDEEDKKFSLSDLKEVMSGDLQIDPKTGRRMYNGFQLIRATPESDDHLEVLRFLEKGTKRALFNSCTFLHFYYVL